MGYTTDFWGEVNITPPLNQAEIDYLNKFNETRRVDRARGPYFVDGTGSYGQNHAADIRDFNRPPQGQPGLWCQWSPTPDGTAIEWDGGEKFYSSDLWMAYLIDHFLKPNAKGVGAPELVGFTFDHVLNGEIDAQGEDPGDRWKLIVKDNKVTVKTASLVWPD